MITLGTGFSKRTNRKDTEAPNLEGLRWKQRGGRDRALSKKKTTEEGEVNNATTRKKIKLLGVLEKTTIEDGRRSEGFPVKEK